MMTPEREELIVKQPDYIAWEVKEIGRKDGWSVLRGTEQSQSCGLPHRTWLAAAIELLLTHPYPPARIVRHDDEMRRWGYLMGVIEPTDDERKQLPPWHRNHWDNRESW